ncbi:L,D-transpeptidase family protein [Pelagibacteraceae bacterium]|nr:L,D-transpeptidase family protein [Pelagibacteraceae bacterium]
MHILINKKYLTYDNYKVKCAVGKRGIGSKKKEGDFITPKGQYKIKYLLYRKDRVGTIQTKLKKFIIKRYMGWCDDPNSKKYNKLVYLPFNCNYENIYRRENIYDIILVLDYNMRPIKKGKGSAIFIHIAKKNYKKTKGCVAIKKTDLLKIIQKLKINTKVKIENQK